MGLPDSDLNHDEENCAAFILVLILAFAFALFTLYQIALNFKY